MDTFVQVMPLAGAQQGTEPEVSANPAPENPIRLHAENAVRHNPAPGNPVRHKPAPENTIRPQGTQ